MLVLVWTLLVGLAVLQFVPGVPKTTGGWVLLVMLGPPLYLGLEWLFGKMFSRATGERVSQSVPARTGGFQGVCYPLLPDVAVSEDDQFLNS